MRTTAKGIVPGSQVSVARNGSRRAIGAVLRLLDTNKGTYCEYRCERTGNVHLAALSAVKVDRKRKGRP